MSKRSQLDKYPNYMTGTVTQTGNDTFTTSQFSTPIPRLQTKGGKATVMELLWIDLAFSDPGFNNLADALTVSFYGGNSSTSSVRTSNPRGIAFYGIVMELLTSGASIVQNGNVRIDLASKDGYGYLFAGDVINCAVSSVATGKANVAYFRIYYRFVEIPITEFVGLVQSQQQGTS